MKTYLVVVESVYDYEVEHKYQSFVSKNDAQRWFNARVNAIREVAPKDWVAGDECTSTSFGLYEEGYYAQNHVGVELVEMELEGYVDLKVSALKKEERERFLEVAKELKYDKFEEGYEVYTLPESDDNGYDNRPVILCEFDGGPVNLRVDRIVRHGNFYTLEGEDNQGWSDEYSADLEDVECGHLDFLTQAL